MEKEIQKWENVSVPRSKRGVLSEKPPFLMKKPQKTLENFKKIGLRYGGIWYNLSIGKILQKNAWQSAWKFART